jgi:hypothetical protein
MYEAIKSHPPVRKLYADRLVAEGVLSADDVERVDREVRALADRVGVGPQQPGEVVVALALAQQELEDRPLVGWERLETAHRGPEGSDGGRYRAALA